MSKRIDSLINKIDESKLVSIDIETTGLDRHRNDINTVQLYYFNKTNELKGAYIEWESLNTSEKHELLTKLKKLKFVTHNGKFDFLFLYAKTGIALDIYADTLVMAHVLGEEELNLNRIVEKYFKDFYDIPLKDKIKLSGDTLKTYAMKDAEYTLKMYKIFKHMLKKENLEYVYSYELRAYKAYYEVEKTGVPVSPRRYEIKQKLIEEIKPLEEKLLGFADINFNSTKELANVMFSEKGKPLTRQKSPFYAILDKEENIIEQGFPKIKEAREVAKDIANEMGIKVKVKKVIPEEPEIYGYGLGLEVVEYTDSGAPSTGKDTLASYVGEPFVDLLTEYKKKTKLVTFIDSWEDLQVEGRIYPSFNITARTGRTTCNNPNLKNVGSFTVMCQNKLRELMEAL